MTKEHAHAEKESLKKHGDAMEKAMEDADRHTAAAGKRADPVPMPDNGSHGRSHAAHLNRSGGQEHTKPEGAMRHGKGQGELRQPPMMQQRIGRQYK